MATPKKGYRYKNEVLPGTTTIIGRFKDSNALIRWAWKQGHEGKELYGDDSQAGQALKIGTATHSMIEAHINGKSPKVALNKELKLEVHKKKARTSFEAYLHWEKSNNLVLLSKFQEVQLVSPQWKFGGTPDAIGRMGDEVVLLDWKTSNGIYSDYIIQLAAYQHLVDFGVRMDNGKKLPFVCGKGAHLLRFSKENADFNHAYFADLSEGWETFKLFRQAYDLDKLLKKRM